MVFLLLFIFELFALFLVSKQFSKTLSFILFRLTKSEKITVYLLSFLFFPGVVVHEISHFLMARILMVYAGEIELLPKRVEDEIKLGSVGIAKTDPIRRFLIGIAPLVCGTGIIIGALWFFSSVLPNSIMDIFTVVWWKVLLLLYVVFEISATMFSSKKDMEGSLIIAIIVILLTLLLYGLGVRVEFSFIESLFSPQVTEFFKKIDIFLLIPLAFNGLMYFFLEIGKRKLKR